MKKIKDAVYKYAPALLLLAAVILTAVSAVVKDPVYAAHGVKAFVAAVLLDKL